MCHVLLSRLQAEGIAADYARDPVRGLALCRDQQYDVVVLDLGSPGMSGWTVSQALASCKRRPLIVAVRSSPSGRIGLDGSVVPVIFKKSPDLTLLTDVIVESAREYHRLIA